MKKGFKIFKLLEESGLTPYQICKDLKIGSGNYKRLSRDGLKINKELLEAITSYCKDKGYSDASILESLIKCYED